MKTHVYHESSNPGNKDDDVPRDNHVPLSHTSVLTHAIHAAIEHRRSSMRLISTWSSDPWRHGYIKYLIMTTYTRPYICIRIRVRGRLETTSPWLLLPICNCSLYVNLPLYHLWYDTSGYTMTIMRNWTCFSALTKRVGRYINEYQMKVRPYVVLDIPPTNMKLVLLVWILTHE